MSVTWAKVASEFSSCSATSEPLLKSLFLVGWNSFLTIGSGPARGRVGWRIQCAYPHPPPPSSKPATAGRTSKIPLPHPPPHWDRRATWPNHIKLMSSSALAPMWNPPVSESAEQTQWALFINHYSEVKYRFSKEKNLESTIPFRYKITNRLWKKVFIRRPPPFTLLTITYKVAVYAPAEREVHSPNFISTLYVLCGRYSKRMDVHPPPSPSWADFVIMMKCKPESSVATLCTLWR
jgi:hypothetical protein